MKTQVSLTKTLNKGFTLIELLIVIAILGVLAVVVLSALNPVEQINKSRDAATVSDAEQLIGGIERYYANTQLYPWQIASGDSKLTTWADTQAVTWGVSGCNQNTTCALANLTSTTTELKSSFKTRLQDTNNTKIYAHNIGTTGSSTYLCFKPKSQTFAKVASARCIAGLPSDAPSSSTQACPTGCSVAGTDSCFYCIP